MVEAAAVAEVTASDETKRNAAKYPLLRHVGTVRKNKGKVNFSYGDLCLRFKVCSMRKEY